MANENGLKVILACDACAFDFKEKVLAGLRELGHDVADAGCYSCSKGYYVDAAEAVCNGVKSAQYDRGVLICGSGQGMNIVANKFSGIRSTICYDHLEAKLSRADNNTNVLCTGAWFMSADDCIKMIDIWLISDYYETNNVYGLQKIAQFEQAMKS